MSFRLFGKLVLFLFIVFFCVACIVLYNQRQTTTKTNPIVNESKETTNLKIFNPTPANKQGYTVSHTYFTLSYSEQHEQAEWVAYLLKPEYLIKNTEREDKFRIDPRVSTKSAEPSDYKNSGYDRGHLLPSADMAFSAEANSETFYMSNMSPQVPAFNRGIWKQLEEQVRNYVHQKGELFVITGPILNDNLPEIGKNGVDVPVYYYKIIADIDSNHISTCAYLLKNEKSDLALRSFVVSIDSIEQLNGIDFFTAFPDSLETIFESSISCF